MKTDSSPIINASQIVRDVGDQSNQAFDRCSTDCTRTLNENFEYLATSRVSIIKRKRGAARGGLTGEAEEEEMHHRGRVPTKPFQCGKSQALINGCRRMAESFVVK